jgi:hypothetical protein
VQQISEEMQNVLEQGLAGKGRGGAREATKLEVGLQRIDKMCRALCEIWLDLILRKNGRLTRQDAAFIAQKIEEVLAGARTSLISGRDRPMLGSAGGGVERRTLTIIGSIRRDLEIRVREQEVFPNAKAEMAQNSHVHLNISNSNVSNLNLGSQVGSINSALQSISGEGEAQNLAKALKEITEAVIADATLQDSQKREAVQALSDVARQSRLDEAERSTGTLKAIFTWLPTLISASADLTVLWDKIAPTVKTFFGL